MDVQIKAAFLASSQLESAKPPNKIYFEKEGKVYAMASADLCVKSRVFLDGPKEDDLVEGILKGVKDYKAGRLKEFKNKEQLLDHLKSL
jgi:chromatin segregation and condensation protein Rec8/ScpA/Scc1 (kleisin family)